MDFYWTRIAALTVLVNVSGKGLPRHFLAEPFVLGIKAVN